MWSVLRCVLYSPYSPVCILYLRRLYYSAIKTIFIYKIIGALTGVAFAMKMLIKVPAHRVAMKHGYLTVVFFIVPLLFYYQNAHQKKGHLAASFFINQVLSC